MVLPSSLVETTWDSKQTVDENNAGLHGVCARERKRPLAFMQLDVTKRVPLGGSSLCFHRTQLGTRSRP